MNKTNKNLLNSKMAEYYSIFFPNAQYSLRYSLQPRIITFLLHLLFDLGYYSLRRQISKQDPASPEFDRNAWVTKIINLNQFYL